MPRKSDANSIARLEKLVTGFPAAARVMNVTVVYEDFLTRKWAGEVFQKLEAIVGTDAVRGSWWNLADLGEPAVLAGAVSQAMRSDMIVLAVGGSEGLPLPFYFWVNSWLPHRAGGVGALVGLLAAPMPRNSESGRLRKYLRTVARQARMDLLVTERAVETRAQSSLFTGIPRCLASPARVGGYFVGPKPPPKVR